MELQEKLIDLGFSPNKRVFNGFRPHFIRGNDLLFLLGSNYSPGRICKIGQAYSNYTGKIYGVLTNKAPRLAGYDWMANKNLTLIAIQGGRIKSAWFNSETWTIEYDD